MSNKIIIFDTTLRDGEQSPGASMNMQEKFRLAQQLVKLKVDVIEAGFPVASPGDFECVRNIAEHVRGRRSRLSPAVASRISTGPGRRLRLEKILESTPFWPPQTSI